jgi:hypothetical protein
MFSNAPPPEDPVYKILAGFILFFCFAGLLAILGLLGLGVWKFVELIA